MGPIWGRQDPGGPHVGPMSLAIWVKKYRYPQTDSLASVKSASIYTTPYVLNIRWSELMPNGNSYRIIPPWILQNGPYSLYEIYQVVLPHITLYFLYLRYNCKCTVNCKQVHCGGIHSSWWRHFHFPRYWPFVRGTHRSPVDSLNNCQWSGALMFSSICAWTKRWANNRVASGLRRHRAHDEVPVMAKMEAWKTSTTYRPKAGKFGRTLVLLYNWTHSVQSFLQETVNYISNFDNLSTLCM